MGRLFTLTPAPGTTVLSGMTFPPVIRFGGIDITAHVEIAECELTAAANGGIGTAKIAIKDFAATSPSNRV